MSREKQIKTTNWLTKGIPKEQLEREKQEAIMSAYLQECFAEFSFDFDAISEKMVAIGYRKQSEWISVDERLPENYEHCLLFLDNETMEIGWYHETAKKFVVGGLVTLNRVTYWMPLPEAPKMKGGAEQ